MIELLVFSCQNSALNPPPFRLLHITMCMYGRCVKVCVTSIFALFLLKLLSQHSITELNRILIFMFFLCVQADLSPSLCTYVNLKHFLSADLSKLRLNHNADAYHYDEDLDRTVFTKRVGKTVSLSSPKFSFHTIRWINIE